MIIVGSMSDLEKQNPQKEKKQRPPREVTANLLRKQALRYLDRFAATTQKIRRHLMTKNAKAIEFHQQDPEAIMLMIDLEVAKLVDAGILNDQEYASGKARSMARQGKSSLQIGVKLSGLGFDDSQLDTAMDRLKTEEGFSDRKAAAKYIKKRRFGPFKPPEVREERHQKELAALVRNGFDYSLAKALLMVETPAEIEDIIYGSD